MASTLRLKIPVPYYNVFVTVKGNTCLKLRSRKVYHSGKSVRRTNEGLNFFYKIAALSLLRHMQGYPSINYGKTVSKIREALGRIDLNLVEIDKNPYCLPVSELEQIGLYKKKYMVYGAYLSAISSLPILYQVAGDRSIISSIFAKTVTVTSMKVFDNINDRFHGFNHAVRSLQKYRQALTCNDFLLNEMDDCDLQWVKKAENSTYLMARWAYNTLANPTSNTSEMFEKFKQDVHNCISGQAQSFYQKADKLEIMPIDLPNYLERISTKGFGKLWIDIDFCFYEKSIGELSEDDRKTVGLINKSLDFLFKALCIYDDTTDLREDLADNIINSAVILGIDQGKLSLGDLQNVSVKSLEERKILFDTVKLGDLCFLKSINHLLEAEKYSKQMDVQALIYCARILRLFLLRKMVLEKRNISSVNELISSFKGFEKLRLSIPDHILSYAKLLDRI